MKDNDVRRWKDRELRQLLERRLLERLLRGGAGGPCSCYERSHGLGDDGTVIVIMTRRLETRQKGLK